MSEYADPLFTPHTLGDVELPNRVLMAPLTRARAGEGDVPTDLTVEYYRQRAGAGLIFSEATQVSAQGKGYAFTPGIYSEEQVTAWRRITDAVHEAGGRIHLQLWHVGRISRPELQPGQERPVAPSAFQPNAQVFVSADSGMVPVLEPRALETEEIPDIVTQFRHGAENAQQAGFDGVEIHAANGYLLDQFLRSGSNHRNDAYGGSVANRIRLPLEVVDTVLEVWGTERTGVRVSPTGTFNDMHDDDPVTLYGAFAEALQSRGIAYLEVVEDSFQGNEVEGRPEPVIDAIRAGFRRTYIANGAYTADEARERIRAGRCELASFGRPFIANPDLPERFRCNAPLNAWDESTFYGGDERGYTDYPFLSEHA
ncbi:MAG: alkene reductase [Halorhodospira sp.]